MAHQDQESNTNINNYFKYLVSEIVKVNSKVDSYANWLLQYTKKDKTLLELINSFPKFVMIPPAEEGENGAVFDKDQVTVMELENVDDISGSSYFEVGEPRVDYDDKTSYGGYESEFCGSEDIKPLFGVECLENIDGISNSIPLDVQSTNVKEEDPENLGPNNLNQSEQEESANEIEIGDSAQTDPSAKILALMKPCSVKLKKVNMLNNDDTQCQSPDGSNKKTGNTKAVCQKNFKCTICNKQFRSSAELNRHIRVHSGEKPFRCSVCGNHFALKASLKVHFRIHTGEKPFQCSVCKNRFRDTSALDKHFVVHTGEKRFQCSVCRISFSHKHVLKDHFRIHTGEKPFQCSVCKNNFRQKTSLNRHFRIHTGEKPFSESYEPPKSS